ncbi:MAG: carbon-nitrogen hydrolase family protein, partial [Synergistaceae bacterium]|nr:carbon-nitrogen hydrolase family protein [Synergistaceae bacterium]
ICYDLRFPELFRAMALRDAKVIVVPSEFNINTGPDHWETLLRARAIENACWIVAPDQIGTKRNMTSTGRSMVVDPFGNVIAKASDRECVLMAEIDTDYVDTVRARMPSLNHRRPDVYGHVC